MKAETLEKSNILILLPSGRYTDFYYICYCDQPRAYNRRATQLMCIYFFEKILGNVVIFLL